MRRQAEKAPGQARDAGHATRWPPTVPAFERPAVLPAAEDPALDPRVIDELCDELAAQFPDPVDVFEDELAERQGPRRHPGCSLAEWRRARVRAIDAHDGGDFSG